ncbi:efflux RND transporter permease subunit [Solitalea sp. MAHUQ-68]|uniref:Efflux RND transporter permease subunit n=1 Tax=Solitalea agri TaxID=2953739 RepID=A0A9X2F7T3_9SPHI|nr:efflux RND transporter permease subunit [Solitalea agri]MCO4293298.1 efflux RND transporter permease subunit [Solitalea agri]
MLKKFIERPVLATVISVILVMLGAIGLYTLPITQFPDIAPPSVQVTASYPGANAETVLRSVVIPLEEAINGVENMTYIKSTASNDGSVSVSVFFKLGTNADEAAVNVQNRVSGVTNQLPVEVVQSGITTVKQLNSFIMLISLYSDNDKLYDETFLQNYGKINIIPEIKRVPGVGQAIIFGNKDYSMRIWLNPQQLASYKLSPKEVLDAIQDQNLEAAPGKFGEGSKESFEYVIKYKGKLSQPLDYENIVIRSNNDGSILRLKDVARVEFGSSSYSGNTLNNGRQSTMVAIFQTAGSNANEVQTQINELIAKAAKAFPKGVHYDTIYSTKEQLDESISQVKSTLIEAFILVFLVVFLFLQDFRSTLIPAIAVPVAIIGTFFFMLLFGFSINLLTLFALVLAIGIVVDDAIVVVEAVHVKMEQTHWPARKATFAAMSEISGAIVSITLVMSAVFLPVGFFTGPTGVFYRQFAFTLAIAILISAVNALTLSPALSALFLKNVHADGNGVQHKQNFSGRFFSAFNAGFGAMTTKYVKSLQFLIRHKWISLGGLAIITIATIWFMISTPKGFIPNEDNGFAAVAIALPAGSSLERTNEVLKKADSVLRAIPAVSDVIAISGFNLLSNSASPSFGMAFANLRDMKDRGEVSDINGIVGLMNQQLSQIKEASCFVFTFPTVPGFGNVDGLEMVLQDRTGGDLNKFSQTAFAFNMELMQQKEIAVAYTTFKNDYPQFELEVDQVKAKQLGVNVKDLMAVMQAFYGGMMASDFNRFGKYYRVMMQADAPYRQTEGSLTNAFVKNDKDEMVPLNTIAKLKRVYGPESLDRYNMFNSITVNIMPKPGFSTGDALNRVEEVASRKLPRGYSFEWTGMSKEEKNSGGQSVLIFSLCVLFVYFLLCAQYESYIVPLAVILSIPTGMLGVFVAINLTGIQNNIYVQVGLIMLIGLLAKNAILIVEYAIQRRRAGMSLMGSAIEAAQLRLRPIIMTSIAFVVGLIPLMRATGPSAIGNHSISISAAGGMLAGVVLGLFIIPVLFIVFQFIQEKITGKAYINKFDDEEKEEPALR